jgi:hypothetical protein
MFGRPKRDAKMRLSYRINSMKDMLLRMEKDLDKLVNKKGVKDDDENAESYISPKD